MFWPLWFIQLFWLLLLVPKNSASPYFSVSQSHCYSWLTFRGAIWMSPKIVCVFSFYYIYILPNHLFFMLVVYLSASNPVSSVSLHSLTSHVFNGHHNLQSHGISLVRNTCILFLLSLFCSDSYFSLPTLLYTIPKRCIYIWLSYLACSFLPPSSSRLATPFLIPLSSSIGPHCLSNKHLGFTLAFKAFYKSG